MDRDKLENLESKQPDITLIKGLFEAAQNAIKYIGAKVDYSLDANPNANPPQKKENKILSEWLGRFKDPGTY